MQTLDLFNKPKLLSHYGSSGSRKQGCISCSPTKLSPSLCSKGLQRVGSNIKQHNSNQSENEGLWKPIREASLFFVIYVNNHLQNCLPSFCPFAMMPVFKSSSLFINGLHWKRTSCTLFAKNCLKATDYFRGYLAFTFWEIVHSKCLLSPTGYKEMKELPNQITFFSFSGVL